jgi:hypothetical protein
MEDDNFIEFTEKELRVEQEGFRVTDSGGADWCLAKKAAALAHMEETTRDHASFIERYNRWRDQRNKADEHTIERMESLLRPWFDEQKAAGKLPHNRKSINLPSGTIGEEWHDVQWDRNDGELMPWAKSRGLVRTKEEPQWDAIKKQLRLSKDGLRAVIVHEVTDPDTGEVTQVEEVVPGVRVKQMPGNVFYVSPAGHHKENTNGA